MFIQFSSEVLKAQGQNLFLLYTDALCSWGQKMNETKGPNVSFHVLILIFKSVKEHGPWVSPVQFAFMLKWINQHEDQKAVQGRKASHSESEIT